MLAVEGCRSPSCAACSAGGRPAVQRKRRARHEARIVAEEEGHERSDLLRAGNPPGGVGRGERGAGDVRPDAEQLAVQRSIDIAGDQSVDPDAVAGVGERGGPCQTDDAVLCRDVCRQTADPARPQRSKRC